MFSALKKFALATAVASVLPLLLQVSPASATASAPSPATSSAAARAAFHLGTAKFTDSRGTSYPVTTTTNTTLISVDADGTQHYALTVTDLISGVPGASPTPTMHTLASTEGGCQNSSSSVVKMCLTMYYAMSGAYLEVDKYTAAWTPLDTQFVLANSNVHAGVNGQCQSGCSTWSTTQDWNYAPPGKATTYTQTPRWHGAYTLISPTLAKFQCANSQVTMSRRGTPYTFYRSNVGFGGCNL